VLAAGRDIEIPLRELRFQFSRSGGVGGQNVNKRSTRATLRWKLSTSRSLPEDVRTRLIARNGRRVTASGELVLSSQRFRDQGRNVADCLERLRGMLADAEPAPRSRRATRPTRASTERRLQEKRLRARTKLRRTRPDD
jgi:ribosome-associated protein